VHAAADAEDSECGVEEREAPVTSALRSDAETGRRDGLLCRRRLLPRLPERTFRRRLSPGERERERGEVVLLDFCLKVPRLLTATCGLWFE